MAAQGDSMRIRKMSNWPLDGGGTKMTDDVTDMVADVSRTRAERSTMITCCTDLGHNP